MTSLECTYHVLLFFEKKRVPVEKIVSWHSWMVTIPSNNLVHSKAQLKMAKMARRKAYVR
jgi:hypothetical protein